MTDDQEKLAEEWAKALEEGADDILDESAEETAAAGETATESKATESAPAPDEEALAEEWAQALANEEGEKVEKEKEQKTLAAQSKKAEFKDLTEEAKQAPSGHKRDLEFILDIPLTVTAQLGSTQLLINELLQLGQGSVIELNKLAGEPLEILVNGKLVARGEAVVINEKFGVRLTDIISPIERIKQLG
ncbi:MAG: flagellar motor switch protein FliN [Desulfonauticus sp.]|jgi:flagellar motor switch protein FliN/FliY|nr:flagellar motor switch protein FliN [Desulfonauticus sp.]